MGQLDSIRLAFHPKEESSNGSTPRTHAVRDAPRRARRRPRIVRAAAQARGRHPHRGARSAGPGSAPVDQLPDAFLREPGLQPARAFPERPRAEVPDRFFDPARSRREVDHLQGRNGLHVLPSQGRQVPQQAAGQRPRGHVRGRQVFARAVHGQVGVPGALRAGEVDRPAGSAHGPHHAQGSLRAVPQSPRQSQLLRDPAA